MPDKRKRNKLTIKEQADGSYTIEMDLWGGEYSGTKPDFDAALRSAQATIDKARRAFETGRRPI